MNKIVQYYYKEFKADDPSPGHFHKVIVLDNNHSLTFEEVQKLCPAFPKGWFELSKLPKNLKIEFLRDFWEQTLPYVCDFSHFIPHFFETVEDISLLLTKKSFEDDFEEEMVYTLKEEKGFFRARAPVDDNLILEIEKKFGTLLLPKDYLSFLKIHDGFSKSTDTGMIRAIKLVEVYDALLAFLASLDPLVLKDTRAIEPKNIIPFYESFGLKGYQCFTADWYPEQEMGNIYYSSIEHRLSDWLNSELWVENLAFPTFLDWLLFYLKGVDEV
jgi:hypothetical protein